MCTFPHRLRNSLPPLRLTHLGATTEGPSQFLPTHWPSQGGAIAFIRLQLTVSSYRLPQGHSAHLTTRLRRSSRTLKIPGRLNYRPLLQWPKKAMHAPPTIIFGLPLSQARRRGYAQVVVSTRRFHRTLVLHTPLRPSLLQK